MTDVYVDPSVAAMPDAASHLAHLIDTGHQVVFVGDYPKAVVDALPGASSTRVVPDRVARSSWYVTADPSRCGDLRQAGLKTLLVGPRPAPTAFPSRRCDAEARDLSTAVLEILSNEVMG
jgi:hypothetical protein